MLSDHLILFCPLLLLPSIFPSISVFSSELVLLIKRPMYWSFIIRLSNEYSGLISFSIDWFDLLAVQGTLKSLLQHHSSKASILWHLAFFMVQLSHLYMTTGKTMTLTIQTFVGKVMSLLFNMLSRFIIAFLPRGKSLLISRLQFFSSVQFSSVAQSWPTLCDPMNRSTPAFPVLHYLLELSQIHVCWIGDAIQPSHPLSSPSPPAPNL